MTTEQIIDNIIPQTLDNNCVSACFAMVFDLPIDFVTHAFHEAYQDGDVEIYDFLDCMDIPYRRCLADERDAGRSCVYLAGVPSINIQASSHLIVVQIIDDDLWYIYDPAQGREGKKHYIAGGQPEENQVKISHWAPLYEIKTSDLLKWRSKVENKLSRVNAVAALTECKD